MDQPNHYCDRLSAAIHAKQTAAVVGIDPVVERLPRELRPAESNAPAAADAIETFGRLVIDTVAPLVPAVKINAGFFEAHYEFGVAAYYRLVAHAHARGLLVIGDIKRGDIGSTARLYAAGHLAATSGPDAARIPDAVTLAGYLGVRAVEPFIAAARAAGRGVYVLVRPSDPGADEVHEFGRPQRFYEHMADLVRSWGDDDTLIGTCGLSCVGAVVAPKDSASTAALRARLPHAPLLVPGYGAQGAGAEACRPCFLAVGGSAVVNASRSVIYAYEAAGKTDSPREQWLACIATACRRFAADIAPLAGFSPNLAP